MYVQYFDTGIASSTLALNDLDVDIYLLFIRHTNTPTKARACLTGSCAVTVSARFSLFTKGPMDTESQSAVRFDVN